MHECMRTHKAGNEYTIQSHHIRALHCSANVQSSNANKE